MRLYIGFESVVKKERKKTYYSKEAAEKDVTNERKMKEKRVMSNWNENGPKKKWKSNMKN